MRPASLVEAVPADLSVVFGVRSGTVEAFEERRGEGSVRDDDGVHLWPFHCTRIADGTRTIDEGARVRFRVEPGPVGLEAVAVDPSDPAGV